MNPLVSVILPIYNAEQHIENALRTLDRQGLSEDSYEIIMVDDGSSDGTAGLIDAAERDRPNVVALHHASNKGAGAARNDGLAAARGTYTYFMDVDDELEDNALSTLVRQCEEEELDVLFFAAEIVFESEKVRGLLSPNAQDFFDRKVKPGVRDGERLFIDMQQAGNFCVSPCMLMARRDFQLERHVRFAEGIINEDNYYTLLLTLRAQRANVNPHRFYRYLIREGSVTTKNRSGFKRFDAHLWLSHAFEVECYRAILADKHELACALARQENYLRGVAMDSFMTVEEPHPALAATDELSTWLARVPFEQLKQSRNEIARLQARIDELESSTTWKAGRLITAPFRTAKNLLKGRS